MKPLLLERLGLNRVFFCSLFVAGTSALGCSESALAPQGGADSSVPAGLDAGADLSTPVSDCAGPPSVSSLSPSDVFYCGTLLVQGQNLRCPGTHVQINGQTATVLPSPSGSADGGAHEAVVAVQVPVLPPMGGNGYANLTLSVQNSKGSVEVKGTQQQPLLIATDDTIAGCAAGAPAACTGAPAFGSPSSQLTVHQGSHCGAVILHGENFGCTGATVTIAGLPATVSDTWLGTGHLAVYVPAGGADKTVGKVVVTTPMGTATSDDVFRILGTPSACSP